MTAQGSKRVSIAALIATRPGTASKAELIYRTHLDRGVRQAPPQGLQLHGPIVLVWDNLPTHVGRAMRQLIAARSWLTVYQLPAYAPELNPVEVETEPKVSIHGVP